MVLNVPTTPLKRLPTWRTALFAEINRRRKQPLIWGTTDCGIFAADCALAMTGFDPAADLRGRYDSPTGIVRIVKDAGHENLEDVLATVFPECPVSKVRVGDFLTLPGSGPGWAIGISVGERVMVAIPATGLGTVDRSMATRAFRVG